jgi:hypothetical protein
MAESSQSSSEAPPKLTQAEFKTYNKMADTMNYYVRLKGYKNIQVALETDNRFSAQPFPRLLERLVRCLHGIETASGNVNQAIPHNGA